MLAVNFNLFLKYCLGKWILRCNYTVFYISFWFLSPWRDVFLTIVSIASFCVVLVCDRGLIGLRSELSRYAVSAATPHLGVFIHLELDG